MIQKTEVLYMCGTSVFALCESRKICDYKHIGQMQQQ